MNYGRYFRLNQSLSKVVNGVAIYDYVDLPAYFGPSIDNPMSPKYPISVVITSNTICFRLHYSIYKVETEKESIYGYSVDDIKVAMGVSTNEMKMAHMEEIILEMPFTDNVSTKLSDTIKEIYNSKFPLQEKEGEEQISYGGRFIEQLIRKRYPGNIRSEEEVKKLSIEDKLYHKLQIVSDNTASYSSLWLMDLKNNSGDAIYLYDRNKKNTVLGFLRKLLLDFMFDLKHSDVFQNSADYQKMYSGLMSDFFFSSLLHKCEYYYYRKLVNDQIAIYESTKETDKKKRIREQIVTLYVVELANAENSWAQDVMSLKSEMEFDRQSQKGRIWQRMGLFESDIFRPCPSWFAEPEEEMRRICFPMKEKGNGTVHICNIDTLKEYLCIEPNSGKRIEEEIDASRNEMREKVSRWFLKRYDFSGVAYFHFSNRYVNIILLAFLLLLLAFLYILPTKLVKESIHIKGNEDILYYFPMLILLLLTLIAYGFNYRYKPHINNKTMAQTFKFISYHRINIFLIFIIALIVGINNFLLCLLLVLAMVLRKAISPLVFISFITLLIVGFYRKASCDMYRYMTSVFFVFFVVLFDYKKKEAVWRELSFYLRKITSYLHLFFPRLVASITAAWITLTVGFDLYAAFFDRSISWATGIFISAVVLLFIMYEINKIASSCSVGKKIFRSVELLIISYAISLLVGIVVVDFVGERYIDRGGIDEVFEKEYNYEFNKGKTKYINIKEMYEESNIPKAQEVVDIENIKTKIIKFKFGEHDVFYMRDFLFMFAFIAMFIGIFLQMIIFEEKQMTEL